MRVTEEFVAVRVPATSANLGPGFDSMGLALNLWDEVAVHATSGVHTSVTVEGEGAGNIATGEDNLVVQAMRLALDRAGAPQVGVKMRCTNRIPHSRGMGSSASAIVAGILLARALIGREDVLTDEEVLMIGTELEGHPDNVAPAIAGGATIAWVDNGRPAAVSLSVPTAIAPVVFIPDFELATEKARSALPQVVTHTDARFNVARAALLSALLSGQARSVGQASFHDLLMDATADVLHQEYRREAMEPSLALVDWLRNAGIAATVSGAGPTVLAMETVPDEICQDARSAGWKVMTLDVPSKGAAITRGRLAKLY
ncbi:homoserine kinase [Pauljensenia sp. OF14-1SRA]|uniref:homoserine kinase n=1 Tax=Pauljensenia sp. OF14-1SRA TaxID=2998062 RepID=UPI0022E0C9A5|nr:homoserine kinase [Pauljensenia sp. OF14-1SRA]